jgi:hypothetical protein
MPHGPKNETGMEPPKRARTRKRDTAKGNLQPSRVYLFGGQGASREGGSEGLAENPRVVINGSHPDDELVGQRRGMVEPAL